jgi:hypothetical protein
MRKLLVALACVIILFLISVIYRERVTPVLSSFPVEELGDGSKSEVILNLLLFFSRKSCPPCLQQVINYLNQPPQNVRVVGIVRDEEMKFLDDIKQTTGARFPVMSLKRWKRYRPNYAPTLYGVGPDGKVYFVLVCTGLEETYLGAYIDEFMRKADYLLRASYLK